MSLDDVATLAADSTAAADVSAPAGDGGSGADVSVPSTTGDSGAAAAVERTNTQATPEVQTTTEIPEWQPTQPVALPDAIRKLQADKELLQNPIISEALKQVQSAYDRLNAYTLHLPTVADAKKFSEAFPGGLQDAIQAQARAQQMDQSDSVFYSRDPAQHRELASTWAKDDPEAFSVLAKSGLEVLAETNPEAYQAIGQEVLEQTLANMQAAAYRTGNTDAAQRIAQVHEDIFGRKPGEAPRVDPRDSKLSAREKAQEQKEQQFRQSVAASFATQSNTQAGVRVKSTIESIVKTALNGVKVTDAARSRIQKDIYDDVNAQLLRDGGLDNQLKSIAQAGMRAGTFSPQQQQQWINAVYAKARGLIQASAQRIISEWTKDFLGMKGADLSKREQAASRTDVTGGGSPNLGMTLLTGDKILQMTDEEFRNYRGPIHPDWKKQMETARFAAKK